jgi:hypothetical protein
MKEVDFILIFILILFIFYIPLCWFNESYTTNQKGGMSGTEVLSNVVENSTKAVTSTIMAPLDLLAQGVNSVIGTVAGIPTDLEKIGKDTIDDVSEPVDKLLSELTTIYNKLTDLQNTVNLNDGAAKDVNNNVKDGLSAVKTTVDTVVDNVDKIIKKFDTDLKNFVTGAVGQLDITQIKENFNTAITSLTGGLGGIRDELNKLGNVSFTMPSNVPVVGGNSYSVSISAPGTAFIGNAITTLNNQKVPVN